MKQKSTKTISRAVLTVWATILGYVALAQDAGGSSVSVSTNKATTTSSNWYTSPWVWIVGAAVFILLLVALLNNRNNGNRSAN